MRLASLLAISLVELHGPTGQLIEINPAEVSSLRTPLDSNFTTSQRHWAKGAHCIIVMSNGGFIAVAEECATVRDKLK